MSDPKKVEHGTRSLFAPSKASGDGSPGGSGRRNGSPGRGSSSDPNTVSGAGMDKRVKKKTWTWQRVVGLAAILLFVGVSGYFVWTSTTGGRKLNVEVDKITIADVTFGPFQEFITQTGAVMPRQTVYLDASVGGRVEQIFVEEGTMVVEGQPILELSNAELQLQMFGTETQRIEQINRLEQTRFQIEQSNLRTQQDIANTEFQLLQAKREHDRLKPLYERQLIAAREYEAALDNYEYLQRRLELTVSSFQKDSQRQALQLESMEASVDQMEQNFQLSQQRLANLTLRAPITGQLSQLNAELGERQAPGFRFGQVDDLDGGYKVRAAVDEFYINRVARNQTATTLPIAGETYKMEVRRVFPEVRDGRFEVDLDFVSDAPPTIRRGQTIRFRLEMGDPGEATLLPRGGYFQTTGAQWVYVVDPSGDFAVRRDIRIGRQNDQMFEVLGGLEPGDRVITSSYETFNEADRLVLK